MPHKSPVTADPAKLVGLLWTPSLAVGRTGLSLGAVVQAGVRIADEGGLEAVSLRRVSAEVGVGAMTLYGYVPGRAALLELMLDAVAHQTYADRELPVAKPSAREAVLHIAECNWNHGLAHPWTVELPPGRPVVGPGVCTKYERELEPFDGSGLTDVEMDHLLTTVLSLVAAAVRWQVSLARIRMASSLSDEQWWAASSPALEEAMRGVSLPLASRVGASVASAGDPQGSLRFALDALVEGVLRRG